MNTMKRILIAIIGLMLCCGLKAQLPTCQYWFDGNYDQHVNVALTAGSWDGQLDASGLVDGIHTLHLQLVDTTMTFTRNFLFRKVSTIFPSELDYYFWYDNDIAHIQHGTLGNGPIPLDATALTTGLHTLHLMVKGDDYSNTRNYLFIKTEMADFMTNLTYHCWFDEDLSSQQTGPLGNGYLMLDASGLEDGEHIIHVYFEGSCVAAPQSFIFQKGSDAPTFEITATVNPNEGGTVTGTGTYYEGNLCYLIATPKAGYLFNYWMENGNIVSEDAVYGFTVTGNRTLTAHFNFTDLDEHDSKNLVLYPNPVNDKLIIESSDNLRRCEIYSITGQLLLSISSATERLEVPVEKLANGTYLVKVVTDKLVITKKFAKK